MHLSRRLRRLRVALHRMARVACSSAKVSCLWNTLFAKDAAWRRRKRFWKWRKQLLCWGLLECQVLLAVQPSVKRRRRFLILFGSRCQWSWIWTERHLASVQHLKKSCLCNFGTRVGGGTYRLCWCYSVVIVWNIILSKNCSSRRASSKQPASIDPCNTHDL